MTNNTQLKSAIRDWFSKQSLLLTEGEDILKALIYENGGMIDTRPCVHPNKWETRVSICEWGGYSDEEVRTDYILLAVRNVEQKNGAVDVEFLAVSAQDYCYEDEDATLDEWECNEDLSSLDWFSIHGDNTNYNEVLTTLLDNVRDYIKD